MSEGYFPIWNYPRLKTLKFQFHDVGPDQDFTRFVKALVSSAPNLKELHMEGKMNLDENVLEGSSAVLVPWAHFGLLDYQNAFESLIPALRPETIAIRPSSQSQYINEEIVKRTIPRVLQASLPTLKSLTMDLLFAVPLMCYGIYLENVTTLQIWLNNATVEQLEPRSVSLVKRFDFTRIFPKFVQVEIVSQWCSFPVNMIDGFAEERNSELAKTTNVLGDRAIKIKQLTLTNYHSDSTISLLSHMFPDVKALSVKTGGGLNSSLSFTAIWVHFSNLEELSVASSRRPNRSPNNDSEFCGIFPEEVAELRKKDDEYLKAVNIVPVMPAITCMKNLKRFTFRYTPNEYKGIPGFEAVLDKSNFLFSKVTGFIAFARCPALTVTFQTRTLSSARALIHMSPFTNFTPMDD